MERPTPWQISLCRSDDVSALKRFIHEHWRANHILAVDETLLRWQHFDAEHDRYTFALAKDLDGIIVGVLGYIPDGHFRESTGRHEFDDRKVVWLALWKVMAAGALGVGLELRDFVVERERPVLIAAVGVTPRALPLYGKFGYQTGVLRQYYMVNTSLRDFGLLRGREGPGRSDAESKPRKKLASVRSDALGTYGDLWRHDSTLLPIKDAEYLRCRYGRHPRYRYEFHAITDTGRAIGLLVTRVAEARGRRALRIVDFVGSPSALAGLGDELQQLVVQYDAEYVDCLNHGIDPRWFHEAGLLALDPTAGFVVPCHFEPFVDGNVTVNLAYKLAPPWRYSAFKGDGDQDRPSQPCPDCDCG
jgi:hypothetical protein